MLLGVVVVVVIEMAVNAEVISGRENGDDRCFSGLGSIIGRDRGDYHGGASRGGPGGHGNSQKIKTNAF